MEFTGITMFPDILKQLIKMAELPFEDPVILPARWQYLAGLRKVSSKGVYTLNQLSIYDCISPLGWIHRSKNQGMEMGVPSFTITPSNSN